MANIRSEAPSASPEEVVEERSRADIRRARKQAEQAWADLAKALVLASERQLLKLELPEEVLQSVRDARRISSPAARNRALRWVRSMLRGVDAEAIQVRLQTIDRPRGQT